MNTATSSVAVLVSARIDPVSGRCTRSRADAAAVALGLKALAGQRAPLLYTAGRLPEAVAREYLALGVDRLVQLVGRDDEPIDVVASLAEASEQHPLVLTGARAESGLASGGLPYALAQRLDRPLVTDVIELQEATGGGWLVTRALPRGARQQVLVHRGARVVLATSPRLAQRPDLPLRHAWTVAQAGVIDTRPVAQAGGETVTWTPEPARKQRRPLAAVSNESGASRMARATGSADGGQRGGLVLSEGSAEAKAEALLAHLRKLALVRC